MNLSDGESQDLAVALDKFRKALGEANLHFSDEERSQAVEFCIRHHYAHLKTLGVRQVRVDPYKIVTWFAFDLAMKDFDNDETRARKIVNVGVATLCSFLTNEKPKGLPFDALTVRYIANLAFNEVNGLTEHGIGKNGLFAAFHCAARVKAFRIGGSSAHPCVE